LFSWVFIVSDDHIADLATIVRRAKIVRLRVHTIQEGSITVVHIDGELAGEGVQEVERLVRSVAGQKAVDLTHLMHADSDGLEVIHTLQRAGAELRGVNAMVKFLLEETTH
jgi:anti-anti-sigma regulatory factor